MAEHQGSQAGPELSEPVGLNIAEAAGLWHEITGEDVTPASYDSMCASGEIQEKGVALSIGSAGGWLTDMDSLLAYLDQTITQQYNRIKDALEERRAELEGF
jgi:hypothetical protein